MSEFYKYFKENMDGLGLPAPETLFGNLQAAVANAAIFLSHIDKFGKTLTVGELVGAGTKLEKLGVAAALSASFYVGAVIGSIAVATGRSLSGGTSIADVLMTANLHRINRPWLVVTLNQWPQLYARAARGKSVCNFAAVCR
jgi:hypothetical protein